MLDWRPIVTSYDPLYLRKGTELSVATVGPHRRFAIYEVRCIEADGMSGVRYHARDAETVSDVDVRAGVRPKIVAHGATPEEVLAALGIGEVET